MKNLLITVPVARMIRFFVDTYVFDDIVDYCQKNDINIYLMLKENFFEVNKDNVRHCSYPTSSKKYSRFQIRLINLIQLADLYKSRHGLTLAGYKNLFFNVTSLQRLKVYIRIWISMFISYLPLKKILYSKVLQDKNWRIWLKENKIDAVITTCPVFIEERTLAQECNYLKIPIAMGIDGWDDFIGFSYQTKFSVALVWGPELAKQAETMGFSKKQIVQTGIPYADKLQTAYNAISKAEAKKKFGFQVDDKVIVIFGTQWRYGGDSEKMTFEYLLNLIKSNKKYKNYKILFRHLPTAAENREEIKYYNQFLNDKNVVFLRPGLGSSDTAQKVDVNMIKEFATTFRAGDVLLSIVSMSLLEASVVGLSSIILGFKDCSYPTKFVLKTATVMNLKNYGMLHATSTKKLKKHIDTILSLEENNKDILRQWSFKEKGYIVKTMELLNLHSTF